MKMVFSGAFWGVVLILAGLSVLIKVFFHVDIPVFRIIFGFLVILFGISILTGQSFCYHDRNSVVFGEHHFHGNTGNEYNVVFGRGITDLTTLPPGGKTVKVNTVFAENTVYIDPKQPVHIESNAVFAGVILPDGNSAAFGTYNYKSPGLEKAKSYVKIEINAVFGSVQVVEKR